MMETIKTIGPSGQISLGKEHAGKHVLVQKSGLGEWTIKLGEFIPENERWLHEPETKKHIEKALEWSLNNPAKETNLEGSDSGYLLY